MLGRLFLTALVSQQGLTFYKQQLEREVKYQAAWTYARHINKPMLVIGGPWGGRSHLFKKLFGFKAHGCGDVCLDIDPMSCEGCAYEYGDIRQIPFPDRYFGSAFNSHILEHMDTVADCEQAISELHRVSDMVFTCVPSKWSLTAWLHGDHHLWVTETPEGFIIEQR